MHSIGKSSKIANLKDFQIQVRIEGVTAS